MTDRHIDQLSILSNQAIKAALNQNWQTAISLNKEILKIDKKNVDALNRLGFAYLKNNKIVEAKKNFEKVIDIDSYNSVARKNLAKITSYKSGGEQANLQSTQISPLLFIEDPGKTKVVQCINTAPSNVLSLVQTGQEVYLKPKNHTVEIRDIHKRYLAALPDDLSFRLIKLLSAKNTYNVYIKNVDKNSLTVFIKELYRGKKFLNQPSFITVSSYQTVVRKQHISVDVDKPDMSPTGEEETAVSES